MVSFGILGAGNIAHRFSASLSHERRARLVAASCRSAQKAQAFLGQVPHADETRAYGSHEELLQDPSIEAVYLALPHDLHHEWALRAIRAGKAVLCEKPAMLTADQMREVATAARSAGVLFVEAMKPRFTALYPQVREAVRALGPVTRVEATLCNDMLGFVEGKGTYHMTPGPGAGVLLDCGTYCASWIEDFCPGEPRLVSASVNTKEGIDVYADALFDCGGVAARLECAFDRAKPRTATICARDGYVVVDELHRPTQATIYREGAEPEVLDAPHAVDDFFGEIEHFVGLLQGGATESDVMSLDASVSDAHLLDMVRATIA